MKHSVKDFTQQASISANQLFYRIENRFYKWHVLGNSQGVNQMFKTMLRWTITFLVIALIAAIFGFTGIAAGAAEIAKIIFYIFLVFLVISLIAGAFRRTD